MDGLSLAKYVRYAYDPFGKRRYESGAYDAAGALVIDNTVGDPNVEAGTDRGFTGHEHLDDVGVIHMNARLYDPMIARFMQGDPVVGDPYDLQSYNSYSYVRNRPLNTRDADGRCEIFCWTFIAIMGARATGIIDQNTFRQLLGIWVAAFMGPQGYISLTTNAVANTAIAGFASGAISSGSLKGGLQGAFSSLVFYGVGTAGGGMGASFAEGTVGRAMLHAGAGCLTSSVSGGSCGQGALSAGVANFAGNKLGDWGGTLENTLKTALVGGTASVLGGGKFGNGALTGAYGELFNGQSHENGKAAEGQMKDLQRALESNPALRVSPAETKIIAETVDEHGNRTKTVVKPDRIILDLERGTAHTCECKNFEGKSTPGQRTVLSGTLVNITILTKWEIALPDGRTVVQLGGHNLKQIGFAIDGRPFKVGQGAIYAPDGSRVLNSPLTRRQFNAQALVHIRIRGIRGGGGAAR